jgi:hypothetical protein
MARIRIDVDIIMDILQSVVRAQPDSTFAKSLLHQYQERGGLSKKQLQGLLAKASKVTGIPSNKLATLEAIILKKPTRYRSQLPAIPKEEEKDQTMREALDAILKKYPQHKRVLFLKSKFDNREPLSSSEMAEIDRFSKLLK